MNESFSQNLLNYNLSDLLLTEKEENEEGSLIPKSSFSKISISHIIKNNSFICPIFEINETIEKTNLEEEEKRADALYILYQVPQSKKPLIKFVSQQFTKKKRGRKKKHISDKIHDKNTIDNVLRKIQVHYLSFIVSYINEILQILGYKERFFKLDYKIKRDIKKINVRFLNRQNIGSIICYKTSHKYKINEKTNIYIYEQIKQKNDKVLNKIFAENYVSLFWKIYFNSCKKINLKEYGLEKEIYLSEKVKMFEDLLLKQRKDSVTTFEQYKNNLINCAEIYFKVINY